LTATCWPRHLAATKGLLDLERFAAEVAAWAEAQPRP
jgi:hypothetical protein